MRRNRSKDRSWIKILKKIANKVAKKDYFTITTPESDWENCLAHGEKIGLGTREYELIK